MIEVTGRRKVTIWLNRARLWRWQHELVTRLARHPDINPVVRLADGPSPPRAFTLLLMLEKFAFRLHDDHACDLLSENAFEPYLETWDATDSGRVLDLTGHAQNGALSDLKILYDGTASDDAALLAVLDARSPALTIIDGEGRALIAGLPAVEDKTVAVRALDTIFSALLQLCVKAVTVPLTGGVQSLSRPSTENPMHSGRVLSFSATALASKLNVRIARLCHEAPRWFVAWRQIDAMEPRTSLPGAGAYHRLADDGGRYYADPFLFIADGRTHLFVEEFDQMSGKGLISASVLGSGGFERPKPVLETQSHLSYPHVFAHAGAIWMIPESLQSRTVDLYRAERFPDRWVHEATLLQNVEVSDATVCQHGGLWWMFAATRSWRGSNWDTLSVFWAPELIGPWQPHAGNPILLDHRCARPAGDFFHHDGALWRPAQDCSEGYGTGLAFCRIDLLDLENVRQSVQKTVRVRDGGVRRGPHSLNRTSTIETIDLYGASA
ncbi:MULTISPECIES: hypothetical protein [unclassified Afipia]|uniref:glucosamine inositolphosphorylceramide transferase family protein n=1 Tax=unclassified Afipia TaxID=2642050 RepID=UPI0004134340|nr:MULTISPECIES: hypothetical protein [unclassified Afipia]